MDGLECVVGEGEDDVGLATPFGSHQNHLQDHRACHVGRAIPDCLSVTSCNYIDSGSLKFCTRTT